MCVCGGVVCQVDEETDTLFRVERVEQKKRGKGPMTLHLAGGYTLKIDKGALRPTDVRCPSPSL